MEPRKPGTPQSVMWKSGQRFSTAITRPPRLWSVMWKSGQRFSSAITRPPRLWSVMRKSGTRFCRQTRAKSKGQSLSGDSVIVRQTPVRADFPWNRGTQPQRCPGVFENSAPEPSKAPVRFLRRNRAGGQVARPAENQKKVRTCPAILSAPDTLCQKLTPPGRGHSRAAW